jgi:hypothetical protein
MTLGPGAPQTGALDVFNSLKISFCAAIDCEFLHINSNSATRTREAYRSSLAILRRRRDRSRRASNHQQERGQKLAHEGQEQDAYQRPDH